MTLGDHCISSYLSPDGRWHRASPFTRQEILPPTSRSSQCERTSLPQIETLGSRGGRYPTPPSQGQDPSWDPRADQTSPFTSRGALYAGPSTHSSRGERPSPFNSRGDRGAYSVHSSRGEKPSPFSSQGQSQVISNSSIALAAGKYDVKYDVSGSSSRGLNSSSRAVVERAAAALADHVQRFGTGRQGMASVTEGGAAPARPRSTLAVGSSHSQPLHPAAAPVEQSSNQIVPPMEDRQSS